MDNREFELCEAVTAALDASVKLFQKTANNTNLVFSPLSALAALTMLQRGAAGESLNQLNALLGELPKELAALRAATHNSTNQVDFANGIWIKDDDTIKYNDCFLDGQDAFTEIHKAPFTVDTCRTINDWCREKTNGKINHILDRFRNEDVLIMLNALAFSAKWQKEYAEVDIRNRTFTSESGIKHTTVFLHSTENCYIHDTHAEGFVKPYCGNRYAFAALLPEEKLPLRDYIAGLTGEHLYDILQGVNYPVETAIPKFKFESTINFREVLKSLNINEIFEPSRANLSGIGHSTKPNTNLCVGTFMQRAFIDLNERGTEAAAITMMSTKCATSCITAKPKHVYLDRPFLFIIIDRHTKMPLFMGTITDIKC